MTPPSARITKAVSNVAGSVSARNSWRRTRSRTSTPAQTSSVMTSAAWRRCSANDTASKATATSHERRWPLRMPRDNMIMPIPAMALSAPAAWTTAMGRYWATSWRCSRIGAVTDDSSSMAPATKSDTAAIRLMRRTRTRSAATSGAGGHDAPLGQPAASSACTSAGRARPLTTLSDVMRRSPSVASGRSTSASIRRTCRSAPVSSSSVDSWRWCRNVGGRPNRPRCSRTISEVAPGQAKKPPWRWVSSGTSAPATTTPAAPAATVSRPASSASWPSSVSREWATGRAPEGPPAHGRGRPSPPRARQMPREVTATTTASTATSTAAMTSVTTKRLNHDAS